MEVIVVLLLLAGLSFLWFRTKSISKKNRTIYSVSAIIAALVILAGVGDSDKALSLDAELEKNQVLTEENEELVASNSELITSNTELEEKLDDLESKLEVLTEELSGMKEEKETLQ